MRTYKNARGEGKLFSIELVDSEGGEIKGTFFNDVVDKFYDIVNEGDVYLFSKGQIKTANKQYSSANYEITFDKATTIEPVDSDDPTAINIPRANYNFRKIQHIELLSVNT